MGQFIDKTTVILVALLIGGLAAAPSDAANNAAEVLAQRMAEIRANRTIATDVTKLFEGQNQSNALDLLTPFESDTSPAVRREAMALSYRFGRHSSDGVVRQKVVERLVRGAADKDPLVWQQSSRYLLEFGQRDFSPSAKQALRRLLRQERIPRSEVILVVGTAGMVDENDWLGSLLIDENRYENGQQPGRWFGTVGWASRLARARMGSRADTERAIVLVEGEKDEVVKVSRLLQFLAYVRQPDTVTVLQKYLFSTQRLPAQKPTAPGTLYAQYAADLLAQMLEGFPVASVGPGGYGDEDIERCRRWMLQNRKWQIRR